MSVLETLTRYSCTMQMEPVALWLLHLILHENTDGQIGQEESIQHTTSTLMVSRATQRTFR